jgi:hypothetical protein
VLSARQDDGAGRRRQVGLKPELNRTGTKGGQNVGPCFDEGNLGRARRCGHARRGCDVRSGVYAVYAFAGAIYNRI